VRDLSCPIERRAHSVVRDLTMILAAILVFGILTMWVPGRWALSAFEVSLFALAAITIVHRVFVQNLDRKGAAGTSEGHHTSPSTRIPAVAALLAAAVAWGAIQVATHRSVYELKTWESVLGWTANLVAFSLAFDYTHGGARLQHRERFLRLILMFAFALSVAAIFTELTSPPGVVFWKFDLATGARTLGPFVYRNQYAAFVEAVLPLAIVRALLDRRRTMVYTAIAAVLFASVVAGGSRAGSILCLAEIVVTPLLVFSRKLISARTMVRGLAGSVAAIVLLTGVVGWETIWNRLQEPNPYSLRAELVRSSLDMARDRPLMGFGLGTWSTAYPAYARFDDGTFVNQAHNDWVQWAAEGGIPFLAIMLAIVAMSVRPALRSLWGIGLLAVFLHCLVDYPMQQRPALATFFFALLGVIAE
jgi:O-antigen ligase